MFADSSQLGSRIFILAIVAEIQNRNLNKLSWIYQNIIKSLIEVLYP